MKKRWLIPLGVLLLPALALAVPNPLRVYVPGLFGLHCGEHRVCVEDASRLAMAQDFLKHAHEELPAVVGPIDAQPVAIFCSTRECFELFGKRRSNAVSFANRAIVIGPRGWYPHFVRHELIHAAQYDHLGLYRAWSLPEWLREGMAYSLSNDPRRPLPEPLEGWRTRFEDWYRKGDGANLWPRLQAEAE
jgi:hypothetical protein